MTYYLKFPTKQIAMQLLEEAGFLDENKNIMFCTHNYAIDVVGIITQGGEWIEFNF